MFYSKVFFFLERCWKKIFGFLSLCEGGDWGQGKEDELIVDNSLPNVLMF